MRGYTNTTTKQIIVWVQDPYLDSARVGRLQRVPVGTDAHAPGYGLRVMETPRPVETPPAARGLAMADVHRLIGELYLEVVWLRLELSRRHPERSDGESG